MEEQQTSYQPLTKSWTASQSSQSPDYHHTIGHILKMKTVAKLLFLGEYEVCRGIFKLS